MFPPRGGRPLGQPRLWSLAHGPKTLVDARNRIARVAVDPLVARLAPLNLNLVSFTGKFTGVFADITSKFTDIPGLDRM